MRAWHVSPTRMAHRYHYHFREASIFIKTIALALTCTLGFFAFYSDAKERVISHTQCNQKAKAWLHHQLWLKYPMKCAPAVQSTYSACENLKHGSVVIGCWNIH